MQENNKSNLMSTSTSSSSSTTSLSSEADIKNRSSSPKRVSESNSSTNITNSDSSYDSSSTISRPKSAKNLNYKKQSVQGTKYKKNFTHHAKRNNFKSLNKYAYSNSTDSIYDKTKGNNQNSNKDPFRKAPFHNIHTNSNTNTLSKTNPSFASTNLLLFSNVSTTNSLNETSTNKILLTSNFSAFRPYKKTNDFLQPLQSSVVAQQSNPVDPFLSAPFEPAKSSSSTNPFMSAPFLGSKKNTKKSSKLNSSTKSDITYQRIDLNNTNEEDHLDDNTVSASGVNVLKATKKYKSLSETLFSSLDATDNFSNKKSPLVDTSND